MIEASTADLDFGPGSGRGRFAAWCIILGFTLIWIIVSIAGVLVFFILGRIFGMSFEVSLWFSTLVTYAVVIPITLLFLHYDGDLSSIRRMLRLETPKKAALLLAGIPLIVTIMDFILNLIYGFAYIGAFGEPSLPDIGVTWESSNLSIVLVLLSTVIIGPVAEELMFRGYVLDSIRKMHGDVLGIILSALLFGMIHFFDPYTVGMATLGGVLYGYIRVKTGSLWPSVVSHMIWNAMAMVVTYL